MACHAQGLGCLGCCLCTASCRGGAWQERQRGCATVALQLCNEAAVFLATGTPHAHLIWGHPLPIPSHKHNTCRPAKAADLT